MSEPEPRWRTIAEASLYTGGAISERTLRRWVAMGRISATRLGPRRIQVDLNEIDAQRRPVQHHTERNHA